MLSDTFGIGMYGIDVLVQRAPCGSEDKPAVRVSVKFCVIITFQILDVMGDGRLRDMQLLGSFCKTFRLAEGQKGNQSCI